MAFTLSFSPLAISISIKGNIVHLNCFQTITEDNMKGSVLAAQLYGGDIDISVNVMPHRHNDYDLSTHTSGNLSYFFSFIGKVSFPGVEEKPH